MTTITIERALLRDLYDSMDDYYANTQAGQELCNAIKAALSAPATAPEQPDAEVTVQHFRGMKSMENIDWTLYSDFPPGTHKLYRHPPATSPSWQDAPTEPGMWACLYMGELSTAIFNAYEIEHFDRDEMVGCRWFGPIPEDKP